MGIGQCIDCIKKCMLACIESICALSLKTYFILRLSMKIEEDAIVIEDNDMEVEALVAPDTHKPAGSTYFDVQLAICKEDNLDDDPNAVINRRLIKFFEYGKKIQPGMEYFCSRKESDSSEDQALIDNQLIIFGLDFKKLKVVKKEYETQEAVRINESNFKLIYPDHHAAWKAIQKNAKDPSSLVKKVESDDVPLPRCWFEMNSYYVNTREVQVYARFATEKERIIQPQEEVLKQIIKHCGNTYNQQERKKHLDQAQRESEKKERVELKRQHNSTKLYEKYEKNMDKGWKKGTNNNPGAERERSRSRSKGKANRMEEDVNDNSSDYSFILSKSKKDLKELNAALGDIRIKDSSVHGGNEADLSLSILNNGGENYNWSGKQPQQGYVWSYREYMKQKEQEEELIRHEKRAQAEVVTIQD